MATTSYTDRRRGRLDVSRLLRPTPNDIPETPMADDAARWVHDERIRRLPELAQAGHFETAVPSRAPMGGVVRRGGSGDRR